MSFELKSEDQGTNEMSVFHQKIAHLGRFKNSGCQTDEPSKWCSKHKLQVQNETNLPKRPPQGCGWVWGWIGVTVGTRWTTAKAASQPTTIAQSLHNQIQTKCQPTIIIAQIQTNCRPTTIAQSSHDQKPTNCQPTLSLHSQIQTQPHKQIQTKLTIFRFMVSIPFKRWNKLKRKYCMDLWLAPPESF